MPTPDNRVLSEKYRLVRLLDEGGMGSVWLAEHLSLHSPVAVKLLTQEIADSEEGVQRFLREARAAASLRSPHVVQILDYGVQDVTPYIVMELLDGESLAARLKRVQRLSPRETELVLRHVARAVARAHDAGIVHRDLKPPNIFIIRNEDEEVVKLLDFGIAKAALDVLGASIASNTRTGAFLGTPFYVSPEQAEGVKSLDHRTDIWSMGVIAFECLTGRQPFSGDTFGSLVLSICSRPMPVPSRQAPVPPGFDAWFARACARDVDQRFQSAREAAAALRQVLDVDAEVNPAPQYSGGAALDLSLPPLEAPVAAEAPSSLPAPQLAITTGVVSSSATTRRRPVRAKARQLGLPALGALVLFAVAVGVRGLGGNATPSNSERAGAAAPSTLTPLRPGSDTKPPEPSALAAAPLAPADSDTIGKGAPLADPHTPKAASAPPSKAADPAGNAAPAATRRPIVAPMPNPPPVSAAPGPERSKPSKPRPRIAPASSTASKPSPPPPAARAAPSEEVPKPLAAPETKPAGKYGVNLGI